VKPAPAAATVARLANTKKHLTKENLFWRKRDATFCALIVFDRRGFLFCSEKGRAGVDVENEDGGSHEDAAHAGSRFVERPLPGSFTERGKAGPRQGPGEHPERMLSEGNCERRE